MIGNRYIVYTEQVIGFKLKIRIARDADDNTTHGLALGPFIFLVTLYATGAEDFPFNLGFNALNT